MCVWMGNSYEWITIFLSKKILNFQSSLNMYFLIFIVNSWTLLLVVNEKKMVVNESDVKQTKSISNNR